MTDPRDDQDLHDLFDDTVSDVEPVDRLGQIRARTTRATVRRRRGWAVAGGAAVAAAAVVAAVAVVSTGDAPEGDVAGPAPAPAPTRTTTATTDATTHATDATDAVTAVYYVSQGGSAEGSPEALYRYFEPAGDPLELLMSTPSDPDYQTLWPEGSLLSWEVTDDEIVVGVADVQEPGQGDLALQQLIYTLQAATGTDLPVRLEGVASGVLERRAPLDVLSHMSISDPAEGNVYDAPFTARGVANGYEGNVACQVVTADWTPVWSGATIAGWTEDRLFPWELEVDLTGVAPGDYTFTCSTDDPAGGAEGTGTFTDTRSITVR
ncbi:Gmad2 immunoglobulin-like domain-containing protein [Nocardioides sp. C4-1]|uniref:Gmad2 immunoglobulin-like domain-containing protein n=1 Tax=Nocardioides sp. C4-1 TaxID=3151851 RepID=UPI0032633B15